MGDRLYIMINGSKYGVRFINDLVKDNGEFFSYQEFLERARVQTNFLQYVGKIQAIKAYIKKKKIDIFKKYQSPFIPAHFSNIIKDKQGAKIMYDILNINEDKTTAQHTWNNLYNIQEKDWKKIDMYPMKITKYCTLQWFQICINHNILITNKRLQYMGIKDDPLCTICKTHVETTVHLLRDCSITKYFFLKKIS